MKSAKIISEKRKLILLTCFLLGTGFLATSLVGYFASKDSIRTAIINNELPITSDNVYSEIQKDLIRTILISSMMAKDTFLRDWVISGEKDEARITRYLNEIQDFYHTFTSFFVSERSSVYYGPGGILKKISPTESRDVWYYRVRKIAAPYEINVDPDMAHQDAMTIFVNYRVFDYGGNFIGAAGVGLSVDSVKNLIDVYQQRYHRNIYFVDTGGRIVLPGSGGKPFGMDIRKSDGLGEIAETILERKDGAYQYVQNNRNYLLNVRFINELNWHLFVEREEDEALAQARNILLLNFVVSIIITALVLIATSYTINRFQTRLENMASFDGLTGLFNRQAFEILTRQFMRDMKRNTRPLSVIMIDLDHFKEINDRYGHLAGDVVLKEVSRMIQSLVRDVDAVCRWGGEEFIIVMKDCPEKDARIKGEQLRLHLEKQVFYYQVNEIALTMSLGIAERKKGEELKDWLDRADAMLYQAKMNGRNRTYPMIKSG